RYTRGKCRPCRRRTAPGREQPPTLFHFRSVSPASVRHHAHGSEDAHPGGNEPLRESFCGSLRNRRSPSRQRKQEGQRILFVGDEINDAAAMAESDVAIALGSEPLARAAADIEWPAPVLSALPKAISHSRATVRLIGSNLLIAMSYNLARNRHCGG